MLRRLQRGLLLRNPYCPKVTCPATVLRVPESAAITPSSHRVALVVPTAAVSSTSASARRAYSTLRWGSQLASSSSSRRSVITTAPQSASASIPRGLRSSPVSLPPHRLRAALAAIPLTILVSSMPLPVPFSGEGHLPRAQHDWLAAHDGTIDDALLFVWGLFFRRSRGCDNSSSSRQYDDSDARNRYRAAELGAHLSHALIEQQEREQQQSSGRQQSGTGEMVWKAIIQRAYEVAKHANDFVTAVVATLFCVMLF